MFKRLRQLLLAAVIATVPLATQAQASIWAEGFESGMDSAWISIPVEDDDMVFEWELTSSKYNSGTHSITLNTAYMYSNARASIIFPALTIPSGTANPMLSFMMYRYTSSYSNYNDSVAFYINTDDTIAGATFLCGSSRKARTGESNGWYEVSANIPASFLGAPCYIIMTGISAYGNDVYVDDIAVSSLPCPPVSGLALSSISPNAATITWSSSTDATIWNVYYAASDTAFTPGGSFGTADYAADTFYTISNLAPNTNYYVYVASDCGTDGISSYRSISFRTPCSAIPTSSLPYSYGFEGAGVDPCWKVIMDGSYP